FRERGQHLRYRGVQGANLSVCSHAAAHIGQHYHREGPRRRNGELFDVAHLGFSTATLSADGALPIRPHRPGFSGTHRADEPADDVLAIASPPHGNSSLAGPLASTPTTVRAQPTE